MAAWINLGDALHGLGRRDEACTSYERAISLRPNDPGPLIALGTLRMEMGLPAEAVVCFERVLRLRPDSAAACNNLGLALLDQGRYEEAALSFRQARYLRSDLTEVHANLRLALLMRDVDRPAADATDVPAKRRRQPPGDPTPPLAIVWEGELLELFSLARVNQQLCLRLIERGHHLSLLPLVFPLRMRVPALPSQSRLIERIRKPLAGPADVHVRHHFPPNLTPPPTGRWVLYQPWKFGSPPRDWVRAMNETVDEVWVPSRFVRDCYIQAGVPAERVHVIPYAPDPEVFHPEALPRTPRTRKRFKFLYVGGTIYRKGADILLEAYARAFQAADDVCLVIKDLGAGNFYRGQTAERLIAQYQARIGGAEIEYLDGPLTEAELAGLYTACDCLVQPYRGECFGMPIAEAMASGLPVVVTNYGAALDFCDEDNAYLIPAELRYYPDKLLERQETVDYPWLAEPDVEALAVILRSVVGDGEGRRRRGAAGRRRILQGLTVERAAAAAEARLRALVNQPIRRFALSPSPPAVERKERTTGCCVNIHGHRMQLHELDRDHYISGSLACGIPYEPVETEALLNLIESGDVVLDVGANIGYYTLLFARKVGSAGKVFAFEPDPDNFQLLCRNVEANGYSNVVLVNKAVSDHSGPARLVRCDQQRAAHHLWSHEGAASAVEVESVALDDFFADYEGPIHLIKMDIEGAEAMVLAGMQTLLRRCGPIRLATEFWPVGLRLAGSSAGHYLNQLARLGFHLQHIDERRGEVVTVTTEQLLRMCPEEPTEYTNLLCLRDMALVESNRPDEGEVPAILDVEAPALAARFAHFGAFTQAEQLYRQILRQQPDNADAWFRFGNVCHALGRHEEAIHGYRQTLHLQPEHVGALNKLSAVLIEQGRFEETAAGCREALRLQPDSAESHNHLGRVLLQRGQRRRRRPTSDGPCNCSRIALWPGSISATRCAAWIGRTRLAQASNGRRD